MNLYFFSIRALYYKEIKKYKAYENSETNIIIHKCEYKIFYEIYILYNIE